MKFIFAFCLFVLPMMATANPLWARETCAGEVTGLTPAARTALGNLLSLQDVLHALRTARAELSNPRFCTSTIPLARNNYQYVRYLVMIDLYELGESSPRRRFRFLYQDASTQAHHNVGRQPWTGLSAASVDEVLLGVVDQLKFTEQASRNPLAIATTSSAFLRQGVNVDEGSLTFTRFQVGSRIFFYAGGLTLPTQNPFAGVVRPFATLLKFEEGRWLSADGFGPSSDLLYPLERRLQGPGKDASLEERVRVLLEMSK